ncbi:MAG: MFS transporter [Negativicutes bacterium]|jgi:sugar phosphate permease
MAIKLSWYKDYRWTIIIIMLIGSIMNYLDRVNLSMANTTIAGEFGFNSVQMGWLLSAFAISYMWTNLPMGWLVDKWGLGRIFLWSTLAWSVATVAGGFIQGFMSMFLIRILLGIAEAPFFICAGKVTQLYFADKERGLASSVVNMGPKIANGFAPPLITYMMLFMGWRGMFIALGLFGIVIAVLWLIYYRGDNYKPPHAPIFKTASLVRNFSFNKLLWHPTTIWLNLGNIGTSYVFWLYFTWLPTYLTKDRGMSLTTAGWIAAIPFLAGVLAVPIGGWISDKLIKRGMSTIKARLVPTVGGSLLAAVAVIPVNYVSSTTIAVALITISLFAGALRVGVLWALVGDISPREAVGTIGGIQNSASFIGGALAPLGTGYIIAFTGSYDFVFVISGILCAISAICYAMIKRPIAADEIIKSASTTA